MSTLEELQDLLMESYKLNREQLSPAAPLNSLGIDSLGLIELMFLIEDHFNIELPDDRSTDFATLEDAVACIDKLVAAKPEAPP